MQNSFRTTLLRTLATLTAFCALTAAAQRPLPRITRAIDDATRTTLPGSRPPRALAANDAGRLAADTQLQGITLVFTRTDAQEADLQTLIAAQQNPASPSYHQWLTPDQFATRFGVADEDLAKVQSWLQRQGFTVESIARSRDRITFSGTAASVASAFSTELHHYNVDGETHFAPNSDISIPAALGASIRAVNNLSDFRPKPHSVIKPIANFTSSQTGSHFLTPKDLATIYDIIPAYNAGYNGTNQSIVVVGQSAVVTADVTAFQTAAGVPVRAPAIVLVPNSGTSVTSSGDETESDLDLEYTSGIATGASIYFVYTGNNQNYGVFDALEYAIDQRLAPIISVSYGSCETALSKTSFASLNATLAQAAAQGQTVIAASGDNGSSDCYEQTSLSTTQRTALATDFPSDSQYVTGLGGTELTAAAVASSNTTYWTAASGADVLGSAKSYIPEQVWNDDSTSGLSSGGGGTSALESRPSWQTGVPGIPSGSFRLVPDIALASSPNNAGYLYCSSDSKSTGITGSCSHGFRDTNNSSLTVAGGTSFAAPIFAGMLAIINQATGSTGQGLINPTLYTLASNPATYASAFHDITTGGNQCAASSTICTTATTASFLATTGYDEASGLGSIDLDNLLKAWPSTDTTTTTSTPTASFTVAATSLSITAGNTGASIATVTPGNAYTGTVAWTLSKPATLANACYTIANATVAGTAAVTTSLTIYTTAAACTNTGTTLFAASSSASNAVILSNAKDPRITSSGAASGLTETLTFAFLCFAGFLGGKSRKLRPLLALAFAAILTAAVAGCGSGGNTTAAITTSTTSTPTTTTATPGTYTLTLTGTDTKTSTITASTTFNLTIN